MKRFMTNKERENIKAAYIALHSLAAMCLDYDKCEDCPLENRVSPNFKCPGELAKHHVFSVHHRLKRDGIDTDELDKDLGLSYRALWDK